MPESQPHYVLLRYTSWWVTVCLIAGTRRSTSTVRLISLQWAVISHSVYRDQPISVHTVRSIPTVRIYIYIDLYLEILMFLLIFDFMAPLNFYPYSKFRLRFYGKFHTIYKVLKIFFILLFSRIKIGKMAENDVKFCFKNPFLILICIERKIF